MQTADVLIDAFQRIKGVTHRTVEGLTPDVLIFRPDDDANSIAWLVWHLARVQDDHVANAAGTEQIWTSQGWYERFGLPFAPSAIGYGQTSDDVAAVKVSSGELLVGYYDAVHEHTLAYVQTLVRADLDRIVDESWDPPVSLGVRLVSVISDNLQHAGQAAYVRGIAERRGNA
jgi:Protein of unknown function (DUF664)